jgi:hypothetical protein
LSARLAPNCGRTGTIVRVADQGECPHRRAGTSVPLWTRDPQGPRQRLRERCELSERGRTFGEILKKLHNDKIDLFAGRNSVFRSCRTAFSAAEAILRNRPEGHMRGLHSPLNPPACSPPLRALQSTPPDTRPGSMSRALSRTLPRWRTRSGRPSRTSHRRPWHYGARAALWLEHNMFSKPWLALSRPRHLCGNPEDTDEVVCRLST